ncbi:MAG: hypothetical protein RLY20_3439 [Verrucomicrobiota bacterium]|jgi:hypothetical protein
MKNNSSKTTVVCLILMVQVCFAWSQGFINLNFENPILPLSPSGGMVPTANAIPGWTAYNGQAVQANIFYNGLSLGGSMVSLNDVNASGGGLNPRPIEGGYSAFMLGSFFSNPISAAIGQTGTISVGTQSLSFWAGGSGFVVTFNGQPINCFATGGAANYSIFAADISAYAGQTGELRFTSPAGATLLLDNIQFSSTAIPEPTTLSLFSLGLLALGWHWRKP